MTNLYFQVSSLFMMILVMIIFFTKKRVDNFETKIYSVMTIIAFLGIIIDIFLVSYGYYISEDGVLWIMNKVYLTYIVIWIYLLFLYIFAVSFQDRNNFQKIYKTVQRVTLIINIVLLIIIYIMPLHFYNQDNIMYTYGPSVTLVFGLAAVYVLLIVVSLLINLKKIGNKKYYPFFALIIMAVIGFIVRSINPGLLLTTSIITYINSIMFFTIENPDLKLINELNIAKDQAEKANLAKTEFLSNVSHEIRTPLNAIMGFSQSLKESDLPEESKEEVDDIMMASQNLLEIVNGILDISKIEANKMEIVNQEYNIYNVLDELVVLTRGRMGDKPIEFKTNFDLSIPKVLYGDPSRLKQIILNLLTNAVKYTKKGYIEFKVSSIIKDDTCRLIIAVEDSGIGIKPEKIDKLFTKFERADIERNTSIEGTGLGLAIAKKLVDLMGGKIVVQSNYGKGSKFTIAVDQKIILTPTTTVEVDLDKTKTIPIIKGDPKRVLVVDDNKVNLKVANKLLGTYNITTEEVSSGKEAIDKILSGSMYDLILMDIMMPEMDGVETYDALKQIEGFDIPVVALTADAISGMKEKYIGIGFHDYLPKPINREELNRVIKKFLSDK